MEQIFQHKVEFGDLSSDMLIVFESGLVFDSTDWAERQKYYQNMLCHLRKNSKSNPRSFRLNASLFIADHFAYCELHGSIASPFFSHFNSWYPCAIIDLTE